METIEDAALNVANSFEIIEIVSQKEDTFPSHIIDTIIISIHICFIICSTLNFHDSSVASLTENPIYDSYLSHLNCKHLLISLICFIYKGRLNL